MRALIARYQAKAGRGDEVASLLEEMAAAVVRDEPACVLYRAARSVERPDVSILYEEYTCSAFEHHLQNAHARAKKPVPEEFYRSPVYYKMNPATLVGPGAEIPWPHGARYMDYELEVGLVIGRAALDVVPEEAIDLLFGVTVLNDFSARDLQAKEMSAGLGPAKGKDFATAVGPWITTADELDVHDLEMIARVNGEEWSRGSTSTMLWSVEEIIAYASRSETLTPGELIGTGTVGSGSGLELYKRLSPGDTVELEVAGVGTLANRSASRPRRAGSRSPGPPVRPDCRAVTRRAGGCSQGPARWSRIPHWPCAAGARRPWG
jgi:2-keto-4-pentenoate hydratase/2-oxohepta-3-ene-1,7-dioic acid hydratase in catechol pathway